MCFLWDLWFTYKDIYAIIIFQCFEKNALESNLK